MDPTNFQKNRILLIDSHPLFREGLKRVLEMESTFQVIAEGDNGEQLIPLYEEHLPDIVLMDINLSQKNGLDALRGLIMRFPQANVLIFTASPELANVTQALQNGASGYLLKEMDTVSLINALKDTLKGGFYLHPKITGAFVSEWQNRRKAEESALHYYQPAVRRPYHLLTHREAEILQLLAEGYSNRSLGELLEISEKTVKNHVSAILRKLDVDDRTQAVVIGLKNGWIELK